MNDKLPRYELVFDENSMEGVYGVSLVNDPAIQIKAIQFSRVQDCNFSTEDISDELIDSILLKGEKIDLSEWELIDAKIVDDESVYGIDLASLPTQSSDDSSQDNELFKVRYEYSPSKTSHNSRKFCIKMASSGMSFKKEDLVNSNANPGFGPNGSDSYNIFLYKGGVNCQHFFERKIYLRKNNKKLSVFEALKYIGGLDKKTSKKAIFEQNPKEVSQVASNENNYWKLSSELKDIRMTSEEKRILTSPVLLPEQNIYREFDGEQCNVFFSSDTIEKLQQNFFKQQYQKNSTLEHSEVIDGVFFFESWIVKNPKNDKANELGFDVPSGTWMMSMKVDNQAIWDEYVKTGLITGFSIDSRLGVQKTKNKKEKMNYSKVKEMVMKSILLEAQLQEFTAEDGTTVYAESLDKDMVVFDKDNNPLTNTEFTIDGKSYETDENGVIAIIEDAQVEAKEDAQEQKEGTTEEKVAMDDMPQEAPVQEEPVAEGENDPVKLKSLLDDATNKIAALETENQSLKAELVSIKEEAVQLAQQPKTEGINLNDTKVKVDFDSMTPLEKYRYSKSL